MAYRLDDQNSESLPASDNYAAHNDLGLQSPALEMTSFSLSPFGMDDSLQRTPTTQHEDSDPLLKSTKIALSETNDSEYEFSQRNQI